ncbi:unnamed protein product [Closterium sp. NIES-54]
MLATWIHNRSLTKTLPNVTPLEAWSGDKPDISNLRTFGCICYYHVTDATRTKLEAKAHVGMHLGHSLDHKGWRVWDLESEKLVVLRDVSFFEILFPTPSSNKHSIVVIPPTVDDTNEASSSDVPEKRGVQDEEGDVVEVVGVESKKDGGPSTVIVPTLASTRARIAPHPNSKYADYALAVEDDEEGGDAMCFMANFTPTTYREAMETLQAGNWTQALNEEYESIIENDVYDLVPLPPIATPLGPDGSSRRSSGRTVYMRQPPGFEDGTDRVCKLKRTIYGLKQILRAWYMRMDKHLLELGFTRSECDHALYILNHGEKKLVLLPYVDDLLLVSDCKDLVAEIKAKLASEFSMRDLGAVSYYLGIHIDRDGAHTTLHLHQHKYLEDVVVRFEMSDSKPAPTPMEVEFHPLATSEEVPMDPEKTKRFHSIVGSCMYAAVSTGPDLSFTVGLLGRVVSNPMVEHERALRRLHRYVRGTSHLGLHYEAGPISLVGFMDSDWAGDPSTCQSTSGLVFTLLGGVVAWQSKRQNLIALSSTEAEYVALNRGGTEAVWLRRLLAELGYEQEGPTPIYVDNQAAINLAKNSVLHGRTKHIQIRHHYIRKHVEDKEVELRYVKTNAQSADFLTKPLTRDTFHACSARVDLYA